MKLQLLKTSFVGLLLSATCLINTANAGIIYYENRATFEAALLDISIENMDEVVAGQQLLQSFNDFDISSSGGLTSWGCHDDNSGCGSDAGYWTDFGSLWTYLNILNTFTFDTAVNAFGFDFGGISGAFSAPTLNGVTRSASGNEGAFFGAISSEALTQWTYSSSAHNILIDNITYSHSSVNVPEPSTLAIFVLGMIGFASRRFIKQS